MSHLIIFFWHLRSCNEQKFDTVAWKVSETHMDYKAVDSFHFDRLILAAVKHNGSMCFADNQIFEPPPVQISSPVEDVQLTEASFSCPRAWQLKQQSTIKKCTLQTDQTSVLHPKSQCPIFIIGVSCLYLHVVWTAPKTLGFSTHNYIQKNEATVHLFINMTNRWRWPYKEVEWIRHS